MSDDTCETCKYFKPAEHHNVNGYLAKYLELEADDYGFCRIRSVENFPKRFRIEWCGEFTDKRVSHPALGRGGK